MNCRRWKRAHVESALAGGVIFVFASLLLFASCQRRRERELGVICRGRMIYLRDCIDEWYVQGQWEGEQLNSNAFQLVLSEMLTCPGDGTYRFSMVEGGFVTNGGHFAVICSQHGPGGCL